MKATADTIRNTASSRMVFVIAVLLTGAAHAVARGGSEGRQSAEPLAMRIDADRVVGECYDFWSTSNATSQHHYADPGYGARTRRRRPFAEYINCVRLLGGRSDKRNVYYKGVDADGNVRADFTGLIRNLRGMVDSGFTPRLVLDNVPTAMSDVKEMHAYGNTMPPRDFRAWHQFVRLAVEALVKEFGRETVGEWRFRVGTEPDLYPGHWAGTKAQYLEHYDYTVDAVTRVIPEADIGPGNILNPARQITRRKQWGLDIIDHAAKGTNHLTGEAGTRMRHFSISWYGRVGRPIDSFDVAIGKVRKRLDRHPQFRDIPVEVAEFSVLQDEHGRRLYGGDITEWGASWYAAVADRVYALNVARVHEWSETTSGVWHPRAHVIGMLETMRGGERLAVEGSRAPDARCGVIACRKGGAVHVLIYHHYPEREPQVKRSIRLTVSDARMKAGAAWTRSESTIDRDHGVWAYRYYADCKAAGLEPLPKAPLFGGKVSLRFGKGASDVLKANIETYRQLARPHRDADEEALKVGAGQVTLEVALHGHAVKLIRLTPCSIRLRRIR